MTRRQCFDHLEKEVFVGEYVLGNSINCYIVKLCSTSKDTAMAYGHRFPINHASLFKTELDFINKCRQIIKQNSK